MKTRRASLLNETIQAIQARSQTKLLGSCAMAAIRRHISTTLLFLLTILLGSPALAQSKWTVITGIGGVPPARYLTAAERKKLDENFGKAGFKFKNPNTSLDFDLANDGKNQETAWEVSMKIERGSDNKAPKMFSQTDSKGATVYLVGIPDPQADPTNKSKEEYKGPEYLGYGRDHYSPRFTTDFNGKGRPGFELGKCVYRNGWNRWLLQFKDADTKAKDGKETAVQWLKSDWGSEDLGEDSPTYLQQTHFVTDLTKNELAYATVVRNPGQTGDVSPDDLMSLYSIEKMEVRDLGPQASDELPALPSNDDDTVVRETMPTNAPLESNVLSAAGLTIFVKKPFTVYGTITNNDQVTHTFYFTTAAVNATLSGIPTAVVIGPNESLPYVVQATPLQRGWLGIGVFVWSDALTLTDGAFDAIFDQAR